MDIKKSLHKLSHLFLNLSDQRKVLFLSVFVSIISALAAIGLKTSVHYTEQLLQTAFPEQQFNYLYLAFPIIGITLTVLFVKFVVKDDLSHGVSKVLYAIAKNDGKLKVHHTYSSVVSSTLTVGFGGSVGLEAPITLTGSAIGSQLGKLFHLNAKSTITLVACGATAAVAAIFNAPIAGVVFAIEVLMLDLTISTAFPLLISAITAMSMSYIILGRSIMFSFIQSIPNFEMHNLPFYALLGFLTGLYSLYFMRMSGKIESSFKKIQRPWIKIILGGISLSILIFLFPSLYGEGYEALGNIMQNKINYIFINSPFYNWQFNDGLMILFLFLMLMVKTFATSLTNGAGGVGGVFAPSLFMGGITGCLVAETINILFDCNLPIMNFTLAGMAGVMGSVMKAPLTSIFLIAEISGGYQLFIPLILTTLCSYLAFSPFEKQSIYTKSLAASGDLITHHKDKHALSKLHVTDLIENNFSCIKPDATLRDLLPVIENSTRNIFPLVDDDGKFYGIIFMDDVRHLMFHEEKYDNTYIKDLAFMPESVQIDEDMKQVVERFKINGLYNMVVLDKDNKYYGFISRANTFSSYRNIVESISED